MVSINLVSYVLRPQDVDHSHITDLEIFTVGGQDRLYSTTRYDGLISSWNINSGLSLQFTDVFSGGLRAGGTSTLTTLDLGGGASGLFTGGGAAGALQIQALNSNGSFGAPTTLSSLSYSFGSMHHGTLVSLANGQQVIFGGLVGASGVAQIRFSGSGVFYNSTVIHDNQNTFASDITDVQSAVMGSNTYVFTISGQENGITSWRVGSSGGLTSIDSIGSDVLWISAPSALAVANVGSETFVVMGAAGSSTISVMQVSPIGQLTLRDHILDTRDSRFGGVNAIDSITHNGQTFVVAGGSDDGVSVFQMLPGGQLIAIGSLSDSQNMGLADISAITLRGNGNGIDVFVASSSENGITRLYIPTGTAGVTIDAAAGGQDMSGGSGNDVLSGLGGDDILRGQNGNDILRDGAGADVMVGGTGADIFVMSYDGEVDYINDFVVGEDRIDLSGWPMLRSINQLTMSMTSTGMLIVYGDERLVIRSLDGQPIDHRTLSETDLLSGSRIPQVILPGYAGPNRPAPALPGATPPIENVDTYSVTGVRGSSISISFGNTTLAQFNGLVHVGTSGNNRLSGGNLNDRLLGRNGNDRLAGGNGTDRIFGGQGNDVLLGAGGNDWLAGGFGHDVVIAGSGNDIVHGWLGNDIIKGGQGDDLLYGEAGHDRILGYSGNDRLNGGDGHNRLYGQGGDDRLIAGTGNDRMYGGGGNDIIIGRAGSDHIEGSAGHDRLIGGTGNDTLLGHQDEDYLVGGEGNDRLVGGGGNDFLTGKQGADYLAGGAGADRIFGCEGNDFLRGDQDNDYLNGGAGDDQLYGGTGKDLMYGFTGNDRLIGGPQNDTLFGGDGTDFLSGQDNHDFLAGGAGDDQLFGGLGNDKLFGQTGDDLLHGEDGNDELFGGEGNDMLFGGAGNNTLNGGDGDDILVGDRGRDTFAFTSGSDIIKNIDVSRDQIAIESDFWEGTLAPTDIGFLFGSYNDAGVVLDFGNGNVLQIDGVANMADLGDIITFI